MKKNKRKRGKLEGGGGGGEKLTQGMRTNERLAHYLYCTVFYSRQVMKVRDLPACVNTHVYIDSLGLSFLIMLLLGPYEHCQNYAELKASYSS